MHHRHWGLSIDRQAEQIRAQEKLIQQLKVLALALWAIVFILAVMLLAVTQGHASQACMTLAEARAMYPKDHLWWHGPQRCWDNRPGKVRHHTKPKAPADAGQLRVQAPKSDANGNSAAKKILWPALVPTIEFSFQSFLVAEPMTSWPPILDVDEITADPPNCCWPKLDRDFEVRWNEMPAVWLAKLKDNDR